MYQIRNKKGPVSTVPTLQMAFLALNKYYQNKLHLDIIRRKYPYYETNLINLMTTLNIEFNKKKTHTENRYCIVDLTSHNFHIADNIHLGYN